MRKAGAMARGAEDEEEMRALNRRSNGRGDTDKPMRELALDAGVLPRGEDLAEFCKRTWSAASATLKHFKPYLQ